MNTIDNIMKLVDGIDEYESDGGWWETSAGVSFGRGVKQALRAAIEQAIKDEREACAKVCDEYDGSWYAYRKGAQQCASSIRARSYQ